MRSSSLEFEAPSIASPTPTHCSTRRRAPEIDVARGLAVFLVIYAHALETIFGPQADVSGWSFLQWKFIYSFHMPLFFVISGLLYRERKTSEVLKNSISLILIAYTVHIMGWVLKSAIHSFGSLLNIHMYQGICVDHLLKAFVDGNYFNIRIVWFFVALALVQLAYYLFLNSSRLMRSCVAASLFFIYVFYTSYERNYFQIASIVPGIIFYGFGHALSRLDLSKLSCWTATCALAAAAALTPLNHGCYYNPFGYCGVAGLHGAFAVWMVIGRTGFVPLFLVTAILGSLAAIIYAGAIWRRAPRLAAILGELGKNALPAVLLNGFFLEFFNPLAGLEISSLGAPPLLEALIIIWMVAVQIALLPYARRILDPLVGATRRLATVLVPG